MLDPVQRIVAIPLGLKVRPASVPSAALFMFYSTPFAIEILEVPVLIIVIASPALLNTRSWRHRNSIICQYMFTSISSS